MTTPEASELILDTLTIKKATLYEAEDANLINGAYSAHGNGGFSGSGYVEGIWNDEASVEFTVDAPYTGNYSVDLRFANGYYGDKSNKSLSGYVNVETSATYDVSMKYALALDEGSRDMNLYINGESQGTVTFGDTCRWKHDWDNWGEKVVAMELEESNNTIKLKTESRGIFEGRCICRRKT